jgi:hypothetical protein
MFNPALIQVAVSVNGYPFRGRVRAAIQSFHKRPVAEVFEVESRAGCGVLTDLNSCNHSFVETVGLPASRRPCFG